MTAIGATAVVVTAVKMTLNSERSLTSDLPSFSDVSCYIAIELFTVLAPVKLFNFNCVSFN